MSLAPFALPELWSAACAGSISAFETLVHQYQAMVSAVAYSTCGDLTQSEDIAQETFLTAWKQRTQLREPNKLSGWLCGIARHLALHARQKARNITLDQVAEPAANMVEPSEAAVTREEEKLVWQSLESIPETYREPLVLFYREEQSIAEVANALDLSEDAVKQRLSRGRTMLRDQMAELVEGTLRRTKPGKAFTVAVISSITTLATQGTASAAGVTVGAVVKVAAPAVVTSNAAWAGSLLGTAGGLAGAWIGTAVPAELAPTIVERDYLRKAGRRLFWWSSVPTIIFVLTMLLLQRHLPWQWLLGLWLTWGIVFSVSIIVASTRMNRRVMAIRQEYPQAEPNPNPVRQWANQWEPRNYTSSLKLLGLPLIDIHLGKPLATVEMGTTHRVARGWIAIGDVAVGILLAFGGRAMGGIALGGMTCGILSIGGMSLGLFSLGGVALGGLALGGLAIGYTAAGGGAIGYDLAVGGGAIAWYQAFGGVAVANDFAVGGTAIATEANTEAAKLILNREPLVRGMHWLMQNRMVFHLGTVGLLAVLLLPQLLLYRRVKPATNA
jgi:zinc protease